MRETRLIALLVRVLRKTNVLGNFGIDEVRIHNFHNHWTERQCIFLYYTVGLVVEYSPDTGETRVQFPDGVSDNSQEFLSGPSI